MLSRIGQHPQTSLRSIVSWDSWDTTIDLSLNICTGSMTPAWVNVRWKCGQEKGSHSVEQQVSTGLWWTEEALYHCTYSRICRFHKPFKLHTDACGFSLGAVFYQIYEDGTDAVIAYTSRRLSKAESHYPAHKMEFLALYWVFHEYLYGSTFDIHTDNNPLTSILTTAKLDAASHWWVVSLANYNFHLHYQVGKANIDADAWSRVSWPGYMPDNSGTHLKVTAAAVQAVQEAALEGPASPIEAYIYDVHILDAVQDSQQVSCITLKDWH